ncbi:MAG: hypothetical protein QM737_00845 [Ferruginibacter sp.]
MSMKKYFIIVLLFICINAGCNQSNSKNNEVKSNETKTAEVSVDTTQNKPIIVETKDTVKADHLGDYSLMAPIKIVNPKSENAYEKYGIDFDGNCYTCDLALIRIDKKNFDIVNVCEESNLYRIEDWTYETSSNELKIKAKKNEFIFTKLDGIPVYELKITGEKLSLKDKKFSRFYTQKSELNKFKQHECGEFDG